MLQFQLIVACMNKASASEYVMWRLSSCFVVLMGLGLHSAMAQAFNHEIKSQIQVNADLTSVEIANQDIHILSDRAVADYSQINITYDPKSETVDVLEA